MTWPLDQIDRHGFAIINDVIGAPSVRELIDELSDLPPDDATRRRRGNRSIYARRNLLNVRAIDELAHSSPLRTIVQAVLGSTAIAVRGILFDKTADANWLAPWHQDLSIAVKHRIDLPAFGPWSVKAGVVHVQPPLELLRQMLTIRLHLDDCDEQN